MHPIQVKRIEMLDGSGKRPARSTWATRCAIRVHVDSLRRIETWEIGFSIDTPLGHMVLASNTAALKVALAPITGPTHVDLRIEHVHFGPGQYYVNANAAGVSEPSSHGLMQGAMLTVRTDNSTFGTVAASVSVTEARDG